ncbi:hypothetical protein [Hydrogenophaga sp. 5NK40-0174]|uniref:hypothetical protein n=1 Tax=Hydrogenophaga sp. 5NK40-0174 TaxID=3127649 RepID=UPI0031095B6B
MAMKYGRALSALVLVQFALTVIHHLYGEFFLYQDGTRLHIAIFAPLALLLTFAPLWLHKSKTGTVMFTVWSVLLWVLLVGVYEGFWNHAALNVVSLLGLDNGMSWAFVRLTPGDAIFESTGAAQFVVACALLGVLFAGHSRRSARHAAAPAKQ